MRDENLVLNPNEGLPIYKWNSDFSAKVSTGKNMFGQVQYMFGLN